MNEAHWHLIVTHIPVIGLLGASGILLVGLWKGQELLQKTGLVCLVIAGVGAGAAYLTGEGAEEGLEQQRRSAPESLVERHEEVAEVAMIGSALVAVASAAVLVAARRRPLHRGVVAAVLVGSMVVGGIVGYTANLGGQIGHPEIRTAGGTGPDAGVATHDD
jgi:hypothetical protein